jgi:hypothetical protein
MSDSLHLPTTTHQGRAVALAAAAGAVAAGVTFLPPAVAAALAVAAGLLYGRRAAPTKPLDHALRRHLAICRRREEGAFVLVATAPARPRTMTERLRISDSAIAERRPGGSVLVAVIDAHELSRERVTQRLLEQHGAQLKVGWATFPEEGMTLDALVNVARARAHAPSSAEWRVGSAERRVGDRRAAAERS